MNKFLYSLLLFFSSFLYKFFIFLSKLCSGGFIWHWKKSLLIVSLFICSADIMMQLQVFCMLFSDLWVKSSSTAASVESWFYKVMCRSAPKGTTLPKRLLKVECVNVFNFILVFFFALSDKCWCWFCYLMFLCLML